MKISPKCQTWVKALCFNAIKCGKVTVKHNLLSSNDFY